MFDELILWTFLLATAVQLFFWLYFFARLSVYKGGTTAKRRYGARDEQNTTALPHHDTCPPVSVIICEHDESENIRNFLHRILNQNYRSFEVLVVSHNSSLISYDILSYLHHHNKQLRIIRCDDGKVGKKFALAKGIAQAKNQVLLLTDADCLPASDLWLQKMVEGLNDDVQIVLGVAPFMKAPGFLNLFQRYEACYTATQYLSFALAGLPYMGVGRNLAYTKQLFQQQGGFQRHEHLASGDDDLFINEVAHGANVSIQIDPVTFVYSKAKATWKTYFKQKTRHFSTGKLYKLHHRILLFTLAMSHVLHYMGGLLVAIEIDFFYTLLGYTVRMLVVTAVSSVILSKLQHRSLRFWVPALDAALVLFYLVFAPFTLMNTNTQRWN